MVKKFCQTLLKVGVAELVAPPAAEFLLLERKRTLLDWVVEAVKYRRSQTLVLKTFACFSTDKILINLDLSLKESFSVKNRTYFVALGNKRNCRKALLAAVLKIRPIFATAEKC